MAAVAPDLARWVLIVLALSFPLPPTMAFAGEPVVVSNDSHDVEILRVAKTDSLHDGMVEPPTPDEAFLLVHLATDDPCFDPERNAECFGGARDELETIAWACGEVVITEDDARPADGGGLLEGELACSYLIPVEAKALTLRLRGYPEITVEPSG